jgi:ubiquinone biosynthesis accessory factor UbiJ
MLQNLQALLIPAVIERLVLVINHVLAAEPVAMARLVPHQGRLVALELQQWPTLLPAPPALKFRITAAGLLEWCGLNDEAPADLSVQLNATNPVALFARVLSGEPPPLHVIGHAALASDIQWLVDNLRWDVEADLERLFGPVVAHQLARIGSSLAAGFRRLARAPWVRPSDDAESRGPSARA